jgi:alkylation response protein AidB-like acyl-CoA dehydrogenase
MLLDLTPDQALFRDATVRFLGDQAPPGELRRLRDDPAGFRGEYWRRGAELGWTSLLVPEPLGGGSLSGRPVVDACVLSYEFGRHAAPGPLVAANAVAAALGAADADAHGPLLADVMGGTAIATWAYGEPSPGDRLGDVALSVRVDGPDVVLDGVKRPVESGAHSTSLLVTGRTGAGLTQVVVPTSAAGVSIEPLHTVDLTRRFATVRFDDVRLPRDAVVGEVGDADAQVEQQLWIALAMANAEAVGAMQAAFDMTVAWAFDRYSFGRPLASYQALKHRFADMKSWLEASHAVCERAAEAVDAHDADAAELLSVAKAYIGQYGVELVQDCVQLHGGIGVTFEHDVHLFLRRVTLDRALWGTPAEHRQRITAGLERSEGAA